MQVARNFFLSSEKTYLRKLTEILLAFRIEGSLSKEEILELYFNKIYLGQRAYGVEAAARVYYGVGIGELSLAQMAELAAEDWPTLQVSLLPSVQWLLCRHNSLAIWRACKAQADFPGSQRTAEPEVCLIWREHLTTRYRSLAPAEATALQGMTAQGWSFAELCAQLSEHGDQAPLQAVTWLRQWLSDGLLQRVYPAS